MATLTVHGKNELNYFVFNLIYLIVIFAFLTSVLGLLDFFDIYSYIDYSKESILTGHPLAIDYNFALLPVFFGIISIFYFLTGTGSKLKRTLYNVLLLFFLFDILLSGSRRGLITFMLIIVILIVAQFYAFYRRNTLLGKLGANSRYFLLLVFILSFISLYVTFKTDYSFKVNLLELLGSKNISNTKEKIAEKIFKYASISTKKHSYQEFYSIIWPLIPEDPDSGWGTRVHKTISPLTGKNVEIVPKGSKGYLMDSTCNSDFYSEINLCESLTYLVKLKVINGDRYKASVYCFVSKNFDGNSVSFGNIFSSIEKKIVTGNAFEYYDLKNKGIWKKLEIEFDCNDGEAPIVLSFTKNGFKDFSRLKGYVIFAYPKCEKIIKTNKSSFFNVTHRKKVYSEFGTINLENVGFYQKNSESINVFGQINYKKKSPTRAFNKLFNCKRILTSESSSINQKCFLTEIICPPLSLLLSSDLVQNDSDPVRKLAAKFISEDTTYFPYKAKIVLDTISNSFIGDRVSRWEFAVKIFSKEFNLRQKLFGGGFNFLNWYGFYFDIDKTRSDYPHNPFLSVLLYSGILGLIIYIIFIIKVFYYYIKYYKDYKILAVFFIITFFFSFFSAGSPFDPPIMGFFVILPFFINSVHKMTNEEQPDNNVI